MVSVVAWLIYEFVYATNSFLTHINYTEGTIKYRRNIFFYTLKRLL